jgi:CubicO group peptidase (beta-lactamase class C family)
MAAEPGTTYVYNSGITVLLSYILKQTAGQHAEDYAREHLFGPLGIDSFYWKKTAEGLTDTEGGLYLRPADLAKIGYLYANDGVWDGNRLLPEGWVEESMHPATATNFKPTHYGYQWWLLPYEGGKDAFVYTGLGYGGQRLFVIPEYDIVAVFTAWNIYGDPQLSSLDALERVLQTVQLKKWRRKLCGATLIS